MKLLVTYATSDRPSPIFIRVNSNQMNYQKKSCLLFL